MEELFVYLILLYEKIITYDLYQKKLDSLFIENPNNEILLNLEWETDIERIRFYFRTNLDCQNLDYELFGKILMSKLKEYYNNCSDINMQIKCILYGQIFQVLYKIKNLFGRSLMQMTH